MNSKQERLSKMILDYLRKNPNAGDTLEGITSWWLLVMKKTEISVEDVADVLNRLVEKGSVVMYRAKDGSIFYKIN